MTEPDAPPAPAPDLTARPKKKLFVRWVVGFIVAGSVVGAASGVALSVVFRAFKLPAASMWPTLAVGDRVFANKRARDPERGAIVVFRFPENREQSFVKRIVGMPGDEVALQGGELTINGWKVPRCNVGPAWYREAGEGDTKHEGMIAVEFLGNATYLVFDDASAPDPETQGPYRVKVGEYFVLGDNRRNSHDSRTWFAGQGGGVPIGDTIGRVRGHDAPELRTDLAGIGLAGLAPALAACLAKRPAETTPPPPPSLVK